MVRIIILKNYSQGLIQGHIADSIQLLKRKNFLEEFKCILERNIDKNDTNIDL
jgi:hypothetical protein